jgi:hypothetical protein
VYADPPFFRTVKGSVEETFLFGLPASWNVDPALRQPHPGLRFPAANLESFLCQSVPRWSDNNALTQHSKTRFPSPTIAALGGAQPPTRRSPSLRTKGSSGII